MHLLDMALGRVQGIPANIAKLPQLKGPSTSHTLSSPCGPVVHSEPSHSPFKFKGTSSSANTKMKPEIEDPTTVHTMLFGIALVPAALVYRGQGKGH